MYVFSKFIKAFTEELNKTFAQIKFWSNFSIFDPQKLPEDFPSLEVYGRLDL